MQNIVTEKTKKLAESVIPPFRCSPIMPPNAADPTRELLRKTHRTAVASALYITRTEGADIFGQLPNGYMSKASDLVATGRRHPIQRFPAKYRDGLLIWREADAAAALDPTDAVGIHIVASLPGMAPEEWPRLIERFIDETLVARGMLADWAIHAQRDDNGGWAVHPHAHMIVTARRFRTDIRKGQRHKSWLYNSRQIDDVEDAWMTATGLQRLPFLA